MIDEQAKRVWDAVLGRLQLQVTRPSYQTWLKDTVGVEHGDGVLVVGAPNTFVAEMLEQRMYSLIAQTLERMASQPLDVHFQVAEAPGNVAVAEPLASNDESPVGRGVVIAHHNGAARNGANGHASEHLGASHRNGSLNSRYRFDSFIVGKSNELAHAAAQAVADKPGITYNPLFIYSGVGLGKTHLLHAIGHQMLVKGLDVMFATTEEFTNEYITAIREGKSEQFRSRYRSADVLLLDDIQFLIGKEQTQEGFFHTFNSLHMAARQVVITSDRPVTELTLLEDRVRSRLGGGLTVDIQSPDIETRLAILRSRAEDTGTEFPADVLDFLAERIHQNVRELEGCLNRVAAFAQLVSRPVTLDLVKMAIADTLHSSNRRRVTDKAVLDAVSSYFDVSLDVLQGRRRDKHTALARQVAMYLLREEVSLPYSAIGQLLGGKDHTTVMYAYRRIGEQLNADTHLRRDLTNLRESLLTP